ncbi:MAG: protein translocase subunit SecF, partial [Planctomycetes bacterium]|nr:protein translocase subunit SecF [Planctomycetota bacterium]
PAPTPAPVGQAPPGAEAPAPAAPPAQPVGAAAPAPTPPAEPAQPAPAPAPQPPAAAPGDAAAEAPAKTAETGAAQLVRKALEKMLAREGLLIPEPFPAARWEPGSTAGQEALVLEVNLLQVPSDLTEGAIKDGIDRRLEVDPLFMRSGRVPEEAYQGISVDSVQLVSKPTGDEPVTRYLVKTTAYPAPLITAISDEKVPTKQQVEKAVRDYFREAGGTLEISEPFPQVATVGRRVASGLQADALVAIFVSIIGIVFYLSLRFEFIYGLAGIVALVHDVMVAIGVMSVTDLFLETTFPVKLNLNELAAVLTIIGFSINDTIVLLDRIRENLEVLAKRRLSLVDIVDISVNQTLARTLWTSVTVLFVTLVMLGFGGEAVRGFAFIFAVGTVAGVYSSVFIAAPIAIWLHQRSLERRAAAVLAES